MSLERREKAGWGKPLTISLVLHGLVVGGLLYLRAEPPPKGLAGEGGFQMVAGPQGGAGEVGEPDMVAPATAAEPLAETAAPVQAADTPPPDPTPPEVAAAEPLEQPPPPPPSLAAAPPPVAAPLPLDATPEVEAEAPTVETAAAPVAPPVPDAPPPTPPSAVTELAPKPPEQVPEVAARTPDEARPPEEEIAEVIETPAPRPVQAREPERPRPPPEPRQARQRPQERRPPVPEKQPPAEVATTEPAAGPQQAAQASSPDDASATGSAPASSGPSTASGGGGAAAGAFDYGAVVHAWLLRYHRYPTGARLRRQQGRVMMRLTIDRQGQVIASRMERSSGYPELDEAAQELVRRASPLPPIPKDLQISRYEGRIPIDFNLR